MRICTNVVLWIQFYTLACERRSISHSVSSDYTIKVKLSNEAKIYFPYNREISLWMSCFKTSLRVNKVG